MTYKLVAFDFDGTLADSFSWFVDVVNDAAARFGFRPIEPHERERLRGLDARKVAAHLGVPMWKLPRLARYLRQRMAREIDQIRLFPGIDWLFEQLAEEGVVLAVVTSNAYENVCRVLGPDNAALVRHYRCGTSLFGKQAHLRHVLSRSGVSPAEAIYVGDEIRDLRAARVEGMAFGAVSWGYTDAASLQACRPDAFFAGVEDIARLVTPCPAFTET